MRRSTRGRGRPVRARRAACSARGGLQLGRGQVGHGQDGTGLRHAVAGEDVDPLFQGRHRHGLGQGGAADHDLPAGQVRLPGQGVVEQHVQDGGHAVGEGDPLPGLQSQQHLGLVTSRVDLLQAQHGGHVGQAPGMHVEHGGDGHVHIVPVQAALYRRGAEAGGRAHGVHHQLPVAEIDPLGQARGASGVEGGGLGVLVEVGEVVIGGGSGQQLFVLPGEGDGGLHLLRILMVAVDQDEGLDALQALRHGLQQRKELAVHQYHVGPGMVQGIQHLLRRQAHIHRLQHGAHHGHGEEAFQIAVAVPVHHGHRVTGLHPQGRQGVGQAADALLQGAVGVADAVPVDDFLVRCMGQGGVQQMLDQQRVGIGGRSGLDELDRHGVLPRFYLCRYGCVLKGDVTGG